MQFLGGVSKKNFSIFQVLGTVYFAVCHIDGIGPEAECKIRYEFTPTKKASKINCVMG